MAMTSVVPFVALVALAAPQAAAAAETSDVVVTGSQWGLVVAKTVITDRGTFTVDPDVRIRSPRPGYPPPKVMLQRESYILVRNNGTRTVKSLNWSYVFYSDAKHEHEVGRFDFRSKDKIKGGEMKFITESVQGPAPTSFSEAIITHVEYEDGGKG